MKFIVSSQALSGRLQAISRVINPKHPTPILSCFLFHLKDSELFITASDGETTMNTSVEISDNEGESLFAISAKTILDVTKELSEQPLTFDIDPDTLNIMLKYQNGQYKMKGENAEDYPRPVSLNESKVKASIAADVLLNGINCSLFATADDELRPVMNGLYFDINPESITIVASDGHKLARSRHFIEGLTEKSAFILPKKPASLIKGLLVKESEDVTIEFDESNALFTMENYRVACRLIEGRYPNYNAVIPQNNPHKVTVDRLSLLSALRRVSVCSSQTSSLIKLRIESDSIVISAQDIDFSISAEETQICQYDGDPMSIGFKASFFIDILNNITGQDVVIELADPSRAGVIIPAEQEKKNELLMLLMPMMLTD